MSLDKINFKNKVILVVEDDEVSSEFLIEFLKPQEVKIIITTTGEDALKTFRENKKIDLVLMDIRLPGLDGYETTKEMKNINKKIPVIAQTAYALAGDREKAIVAGCDDYIAKPIKPTDLIEKMNHLLSS